MNQSIPIIESELLDFSPVVTQIEYRLIYFSLKFIFYSNLLLAQPRHKFLTLCFRSFFPYVNQLLIFTT